MGEDSIRSNRLHYLDWLRVIATLGVFLFHTLVPFDEGNWFINNAERSEIVLAIRMILVQWGMPLFFLLAGAGSFFALRRRTGAQFLKERFKRLVVPFIAAVFLIQPIQIYIAIIHERLFDWFSGPFFSWDYFRFYFESRMDPAVGKLLDPSVFVKFASHVWFLGYLFVFSLILLPLFLWIKKESGGRYISWLVRISEKKGGILVLIAPLALSRFILQPFFRQYASWADFFYMMIFYISGYILFSDKRFLEVIKRDYKIIIGAAVLSTFITIYALVSGLGAVWLANPGSIGFFFAWFILCALGWSWVMLLVYVGMTFLDYRNKLLDYSQDTIMPFYILHHPVIIGIAFFVVQWELTILMKILIILIGSFLLTLLLTEIIRRIKPLRVVFGMKSRKK